MEKEIKNYEGYYTVTNTGEVFSEERIVHRKGKDKAGNPAPPLKVKARELKKYKAKTGYYVVNLSDSKSIKQKYVHALVADAFLGDRPEGTTINHKDGNKLNNNISNLEYCTCSENNEHARKTGLSKIRIEDYTLRIPVEMHDLEGNFIKVFPTAKKAKEETGACHISCVCKGQRKSSGGYKWKYHENN